MSGVVDNAARNRFEMIVEGRTAFVAYRRTGDTFSLVHAEVPGELEGKGVGSRLVSETLHAVRAQGAKVVPRCSFVVAYMRRHPEFDDLRA